jgi:hypothetical protein
MLLVVNLLRALAPRNRRLRRSQKSLTGSVNRKVFVHPPVLFRGKLRPARIAGIVHVVFRRVEPGCGARISTDRARAERWCRFGRCVLNKIAVTVAAPLKCMVQAHPVSDFVNENLACVEWFDESSRQNAIVQDYPVQ